MHTVMLWLKENKLVDLSIDFPIKVIKLCENI